MCHQIKVRLVLFMVLALVLVACMSDNEVVEITRVVATAVPPTLPPSPTPQIIALATAVPTHINRDVPQFDETPTPPPTPTPAPPPITLGTAHILGRGRILDADFSEDGRTLAVAWAAGVSLVDVTTAHEIWWLPLDTPLIALDMQASGQAIAVAMVNGSVMVITADGLAQTYAVAGDNNHLGDIVWSPDNSEIAVQFLGPAAGGGAIYRLNVTTAEVSQVPHSKVETGVRPYLLWSPDGALLPVASLGENCTRLTDVTTGETRFELQQDERCYTSHGMAWSPDGRILALGSAEGTIDLLAMLDGSPIQSVVGGILSFPMASGQPLFFSPDGRWLASKGGAGFYGENVPTTVWQVDTGERVGQTDTLFEDRVSSAFMDDSLVTLYADGSLMQWDFAGTGEEALLGRLPLLTTDYLLRWSDHGRYLAATRYEGGVVVWETATGQAAAVLNGQFVAPAFSPDEQLLAVTDLAQNQLQIYDSATGQLQHILPGSTAQLNGIAFAPDGQQIAYGVGNEVVVAEVETGVATAVLTGYPTAQTIVHVKWSPDGTAILAASGMLAGDEAPGVIILWQQTAVGTWTEQYRMENIRTIYFNHVAALFNSSGNLVAFESLPSHEAGQFQIFVYDRQQEAVILTLAEYQLAAWQSDELLLTSEAQYWVYLTQWNAHTGDKVVGNATGDGGHGYSPDGVFFAQTTYSGRNIEIRDWARNHVVARGQVVRNLIWIEWSPDGRFLAVYASDGTITVWPVIRNQ